MIVAKKIQKFLIITPGIRLPGDSSNDQKRIMTPKDAFKNKVIWYCYRKISYKR